MSSCYLNASNSSFFQPPQHFHEKWQETPSNKNIPSKFTPSDAFTSDLPGTLNNHFLLNGCLVKHPTIFLYKDLESASNWFPTIKKTGWLFGVPGAFRFFSRKKTSLVKGNHPRSGERTAEPAEGVWGSAASKREVGGIHEVGFWVHVLAVGWFLRFFGRTF